MQRSSFIVLSLVVVIALVVQQISARCNVCNDNGIACVSETSFQLCFDGNRDTTQIFTCPEGTVCVALGLRCVEPSATVTAECPLTSNCGECNGLDMFTCTSRTTFVQCNGTEPLPATAGRCPAGLTCDASQQEICVKDCRAPENPQCTNDAPQ